MKIINAFIAAIVLFGSAALVSSADVTEDESTQQRSLRGKKKIRPFKRSSNGIGNANAPKYSKDKFRTAKKNGIADQYIVVLEDFINEGEIEAVADFLTSETTGRRKGKAFRRTIKGFTINLSQEEAKFLSNSTSVKYVEQDAEVTADQLSWGLDRIDQLDLPLDNTYNPNGDGSDVTAYIIDTGIHITHDEFGGRASWGGNTVGDGIDDDCHGHGTHGKKTLMQTSVYFVGTTNNLSNSHPYACFIYNINLLAFQLLEQSAEQRMESPRMSTSSL